PFCVAPTVATEFYSLSLHDALPILAKASSTSSSSAELGLWGISRLIAALMPMIRRCSRTVCGTPSGGLMLLRTETSRQQSPSHRSEEHTSELQSRENLVCRLLLEKK